MNTVKENSQIDLKELARVLWKNILVIALVAVIFGAVSFGYTVTSITSTYQATVSLYANRSSVTIGSGGFSAQLSSTGELVPTYIYILNSRTTLEDIIQEAGVDCSSGQLREMISANSVTDTGAFEVTVTSTDPAEAELLANTIAKVLPNRIAEIVDESSIRIVDYAIIPSQRSSPNISENTIKGVVAGTVICAALVILRSLLDDRRKVMVQSAEELRDMYPDTRILAVIPDMRLSEKRYGYYSSYYGPAESEKKDGNRHG